MVMGFSNIFTVRKSSYFLANTKVISLDARALPIFQNFSQQRDFAKFLYSHFFFTTYFFRNSEPGTNFRLDFVSILNLVFLIVSAKIMSCVI